MIEKPLANNLILTKICVSELTEFITSDVYKNYPIKPISLLRAKSYIENPRAEQNDYVVYTLEYKGNLLAFRTVLPDLAFEKNAPIRFAWCSGSWVHEKQRRKGFSKLILDEVYKDWNKKLMYTNFADASHNLYTNSGYFKLLNKREGARFYGKFKVENILKDRNFYPYIKPFSPLINGIIRIGSFIKKAIYKKSKPEFSEIAIDSTYQAGFISQNEKANSLFKRGDNEFEWIISKPWISNLASIDKENYPFSAFSDEFNYYFIYLKTKENKRHKLILSERNKNIKVLYAYYSDDITDLGQFIIDFCFDKKSETLTVLDENLKLVLWDLKSPFIWKKLYHMNIYSTFKIEDSQLYNAQFGDGDVAFT